VRKVDAGRFHGQSASGDGEGEREGLSKSRMLEGDTFRYVLV
jgi:hypothetical protein